MIDLRLLKETVELQMARTLGLSGLHCEISEGFASQVADHRFQIRRALKKSLSKTVNRELSALDNLLVPPRLPETAISISHCPTLGGFIHLSKSENLSSLGFEITGIGFDIEISDRVSVPVAKKVLPHSSESFLHDLFESGEPSIPACVWAAKESSIKSVGNALVDRQIFYGNVALTEFKKAAGDLSFLFRAAPSESRTEAYGVVRKTDQWIFALAISYSVPEKLEY